ncbi:septum formation family protein [Yinghuangia sp. YIM S09857]|uniref:septum formation family protein n=1 Tax=Yinghuangia sp. YIM S09857 TaxID=3436929 RepID=UPI003F531A90
MTMPPPPGQGGFPPGYGQQPDPYQGSYSGGSYPGGPQYPSGPPTGGPQYPGGPTYPGGGYGGPNGPGGYPGPPGPPPGGGRGPLILTVVGALVVVGGVIAALVFLLGGDDKDDKAKNPTTSPPAPSTSQSASKSPTATETETKTSRPTPTNTRTSTRPTATSTRTGGGTVEDVPLRTGECINVNSVTGGIDKVSCTTPHDMEVLKNFDLTGSTYPTKAELQNQVATACESAYERTVSDEPNPDKYTLQYSYPVEASWDDGDREVTCLVQDVSKAKITKKLG